MTQGVARIRGTALALAVAAIVALLGAVAPKAEARDVYVVNRFDDFATKIDTATNSPTAVPLGINDATDSMFNIAIKPDGSEAYLAGNIGADGRVLRLDLATDTVVGTPIPVGTGARGVAITPDGTKAYVTNRDDGTVTVINAVSNTPTGTTIDVDAANTNNNGPEAIAITPDGSTAIVANSFDDTIVFIDTATDTVSSFLPADATREFPIDISVKPDGSRAYVADRDGAGAAGAVSVINLATNTYLGAPLTGVKAESIQVLPDGARAYVGSFNSQELFPLNLTTNAFGTAIATSGNLNQGIAVTPDGSRVYSVNNGNKVNVTNTATNTAVGGPITVGSDPFGIAIVPNQPPIAGLGAPVDNVVGTPVGFDTAPGSDPDGTLASFSWDFGDGETLTSTDPTPEHTYDAPGTYTVTLNVTDNEGCSSSGGLVYTGQTASCLAGNGPASAEIVISEATLTLTLKGKKKQKVDDIVTVKASCSTACDLIAKAKLKTPKTKKLDVEKIKLGTVKKVLGQGQVKKVKFELSKKAKRALKRAGKGTVTVKASANTDAGATAKANRKIAVKPK